MRNPGDHLGAARTADNWAGQYADPEILDWLLDSTLEVDKFEVETMAGFVRHGECSGGGGEGGSSRGCVLHSPFVFRPN
jgi:hypothetical protein